MAERPNVLFIVSDQHNAKVLGCNGHPDVKTPALDRMAAEGVRFDNAITQNPICTPSRVCMLSGQYCHNHGYYGLSGPNPGGLPSVLGHFRRAGYGTGALGKIHCPEYWIEDDSDVFHETCGCSVGGRSPEYAAYLAERNLTDLEDHGAMQEFGRRGQQTCDARPSKVSYRDGQEGWIATKAIEFMAACRDEGRPFFLHASLPKPHQCYTPAQEFWDLYDESRLTLPANADYDMDAAGKAPHLRRGAERWRKGEWTLFEPHGFEAGRLRKLHGYLGSVSHVDHATGEMVAWLDENGLGEDTIIVYTSDHGDHATEHGQMEKAPGICCDSITRVPAIWRWTEHIKAGHVAREVVESVDIAATLCALSGLASMETSDGRDISAMLQGEPGDPDRVGVTEFAFSRSIRRGKHRLVWYAKQMFGDEYPDGFGELYDLEADPWEMNSLYFDPHHAATVQELKSALLDWLVTHTRPTTVLGHPNWANEQAITRYHHTVNADGKFNPSRLKDMAARGWNYL